MTHKENIKAILECYFTGFKDEIIESACNRILEQEQEPKWIPVIYRMPEEVGTYMTTIDYGNQKIGTGQRFYYGKHIGWDDECVIAWMPLPKPYKAESEDKE